MARRAWSEIEEQTLLQYLTALVDEGVWQGDYGFRPSYSQVLQNQMQASFPESGITKIHIEGKIKGWARIYRLLNQLLERDGFEWDEGENRLVVENAEVWNQFVQGHRGFANWNGKQFPYYNQWRYCFTLQNGGEDED